MFRRDPFAREQWSGRLVAQCAALQADILRGAVAALAPGGTLVFSTCTGAPAENLANARRLIEEYGLSPVALPQLPKAGWLADGGGYAALPHRVRGEGLFLSCFRKNGSAPDDPGDPNPNPSDRPDADPVRALAEQLGTEPLGGLGLYAEAGAVTAEYPAHRRFWRKHNRAKTAVKLTAATTIAEDKRGRLVPTEAAALSTGLHTDAALDIEVDRHTALALLRGEAPEVVVTGGRGWRRVCYGGCGLLWTKQLGRRYNAIWPSAWRIRQRLPDQLPAWGLRSSRSDA